MDFWKILARIMADCQFYAGSVVNLFHKHLHGFLEVPRSIWPMHDMCICIVGCTGGHMEKQAAKQADREYKFTANPECLVAGCNHEFVANSREERVLRQSSFDWVIGE